MKRLLFLILFLTIGFFLLTKEALGWTLRSVASFGGALKLTYQSVSFKDRGILLENPILLDLGDLGKSSFHLHAEKIWIGWDKGIVWHAESPHLTLSSDLLESSSVKFSIPFKGTAVNGLINWKGGDLPPIHFEYQNETGEHCQFYIDPIVFSWKGLHFKGGSGWLDWSKDKIEGAISHLLIQGDEGAFLEVIHAKADFQEGAGNWDLAGKAHLLSGGFSVDSQGSFLPSGADGFFHLGSSHGKMVGKSIFWEQLGPSEGALLQSLFSPIFPSLRKFHWKSGLVSLKVDLIDASIRLHEIVATDISLENFGFKELKKNSEFLQIDGGWIGDFATNWKGKADLQKNEFSLQGDAFGEICSIEGSESVSNTYQLVGQLGPIHDFSSSLGFAKNHFQLEMLHGKFESPFFKTPFELFAPVFGWENGKAVFDIRFEKEVGEWLRAVGCVEKGKFLIDCDKSHFLGSKLNDLGAELDPRTAIEVHLSEKNVALCLSSLKGIDPNLLKGDAKLELLFNHLGFDLNISGPFFQFKDQLIPLSAKISYHDRAFSFHVNEGRITKNAEGNWVIEELPISLSNIHPSLSGKALLNGVFSFGNEGIEGDLELGLVKAAWRDKEIEWRSSVQVFYSSKEGLLLKGLEGTLRTDKGPFFGKAKVVQILPGFDRVKIEKGHFHFSSSHLPISVFENEMVDCWGDFEFSLDGSEIKGFLSEVVSQVRLEEVLFEKKLGFFQADGRCVLTPGSLEWKLRLDPENKGSLQLQEVGQLEPPLVIDAQISEKPYIQSIVGSFAGVNAYFYAPTNESKLIGQAQVDFSRLALWVSKDLKEAFTELEMGSGFTLKGEIFAPGANWTESTFKGIWSGKNCEIFGYELKSLMGRASFNQHGVLIDRLSLIDAAGSGFVDKIEIKENINSPWTLDISKITLRDLRPSLLHKRGEEAGPLTPLIVRNLELGPIVGFAADGKTYTGKGTLSFVNSFKRDASFLDWPAKFFGRIIGLDLDLMTPVRGFLDFELRDGYYWLTELKETFSENDRSEFFLVQDPPSHMDLDGNLEIYIKMKQYVLFKITDAFVITIDGKLNKPAFRLQKKSRFSSLDR